MTDAVTVPDYDFAPTAMGCGSSPCASVTCSPRATFAFGDCCCAPPDCYFSSVENHVDRADSIPALGVAYTACPSGSSPSLVVIGPFVAWPAVVCTACGDHLDWSSCVRGTRADSTTDWCADAVPDFRHLHPSALDYR